LGNHRITGQIHNGAVMKFTKMQGAGNDFIVIEADVVQHDWSKLALAMCDRHFGVGGDGLLLVLPSDSADFRMRVFNADGSEADACGNGLRCLSKYIAERALIGTRTEKVSVETKSGVRKIRLYRKGIKVTKIQVAMGTPKFGAKDIPVAIEQASGDSVDIKPILDYPVTVNGRELQLNFVSMGNPHAVYFWQHPVSEFPMLEVGSRIKHLALFPDRVNFEVANVLSRQEIEVRVFERGAGETMACGSGACAVAVIARIRDYINDKVNIKLPGGILEVDWDGAGEVLLSGPAEIVFTGEWQNEAIKTS